MSLFLVTIIVDDYDEAIDYYCGVLGFRLIEDTSVNTTKRWVVVSPSGLAAADAPGARILLAKADSAEQRAAIGRQSGGRVGFFLHTDDFIGDYQRLRTKGVRFSEDPRVEPYGKVVVFKDIYGNKWDLIEHVRAASSHAQPLQERRPVNA